MARIQFEKKKRYFIKFGNKKCKRRKSFFKKIKVKLFMNNILTILTFQFQIKI